MKFSPQWRATILALAVAGIVGCDPVASSNKDVVKDLHDGLAKLSKADGYRPLDAVNNAHTSLVSAAGEKGAGAGHQAIAAGAVAFLDQGVGQSQFSNFYANVNSARLTLAQLRTLATQVSLINTLADGQKKADPRDAQAKIADQIRAMQGDAQSQTWGGKGAGLPTLAAVKQEVSRLQGVVAEQQQKVADLTKQRADAIATSETQLKHADSLKGDEAVKAFADGSETRRKADDLAIQIDVENSKLARAQADLAVQQGQEAAINAGIANLTAQAKQLDTGWTDAQQRAADQTKLATTAANAEGDKAFSIKALSATLAKQLADVQSARNAAVDQFAEADKYFGTARDQAQNLIKEYSDRINSPAKDAKNYKSLKDTLQPAQYTLQMGVVRRDAGTLVAAEAALLQEVAAVKATVAAALEPAGLQLPAELAGIDPNGAKTLADDADTRLNDAAEALTNVESGESSPAMKTTAKVAHLITLNARIQLADLKGRLGDTGAKAAASQYRTDAAALKDDIVNGGARLPALPGDLGTPPAAPAGNAPAPAAGT